MSVSKSPYSLDGVIQLSVFFNGVEFPFTKQSLLGHVHMSESSKLEIPMVRMQLTDGIGFLQNNPTALVEGARLTIEVSARNVDFYTREFRVNSLHVTQKAEGDQIDLDGYLDFPRFWIETTNDSFVNMTSDAVLRELAAYCGLGYSGTDTADAQTWHGGLDRIHTFCGKVAAHGYVNDSSCTKLAVGLDRVMRYKDVSTLDMGTPKAVFSIGTFAPGKIAVISHLPKNSGGASNRKSGYRQTMLEQSMVRPSVYREHKALTVNVDEGGEVNLNKEVRSSVTKGAQLVRPIDYGNVNENYNRALYQNKRGTGLFTVGLDIVTPVPTITSPGISIFDTVFIEAPRELVELTGGYLVVSHAIMITSQQYHEKFELTRRSAASPESKSASGSYDPATTNLYEEK